MEQADRVEGAGPGPLQHPVWASPGPLPPPDWASAVLGLGQAVHWRIKDGEGVSQLAARKRTALTSGELLHRGKVTTEYQDKEAETHTDQL